MISHMSESVAMDKDLTRALITVSKLILLYTSHYSGDIANCSYKEGGKSWKDISNAPSAAFYTKEGKVLKALVSDWYFLAEIPE